VDLVEPRSADVVAAAQAHGFLINNPTPSRIRLAPPLILPDTDAEAFVAAWPAILNDAIGARP
jgi:acetylornithine aminotransferase